MTDITKLAQSLKAAAEKALIEEGLTWFSEEQLSHEDGIALHKADAEFIALANPANILELVEALEKAQNANAAQDDHINQQQYRIDQLEKGHRHAAKRINSWRRLAKQSIAEQEKCVDELDAARQRIVDLDRKNSELNSLTQSWAVERAENAERISELESRTVKPEDTDGVREEDNKFLVVRHPGKVPVIKHPVGQLEDYLLQILKAEPLATIDIVTHRYYGVGGQFVEDADEYLHEMGIKWEAE
ncbi:TPA: ead/Ea22-like family protein [Klebsiella aerogenes]|nr:ead/Ea22-like family protein [Klebsiella aerogenes]